MKNLENEWQEKVFSSHAYCGKGSTDRSDRYNFSISELTNVVLHEDGSIILSIVLA